MQKQNPPKFLEKLWRARNQKGFLPMIIMIILILGIIVWLAYSRVAHSK